MARPSRPTLGPTSQEGGTSGAGGEKDRKGSIRLLERWLAPKDNGTRGPRAEAHRQVEQEGRLDLQEGVEVEGE